MPRPPARLPRRPTPPARRPRRGPLLLLPLALLGAVLLLTGLGDAVLGLLTPRPRAGTVGAVPARPDGGLEQALRQALGQADGRVAVFARELRSGASASIRGDEPFVAASLFKLPILAVAEQRLASGELDPDARLEIKPEHWASGSGVLQARVGDRVAVRELLRLMVAESDNVAALVLLDALGADQVNASMRALGLSATRLADREAGDRSPHRTTAADTGALLALLAAGQVGSASASEDALRLLELPQAEAWLGADLPPAVKVAHKWGSDSGLVHDAGVVYSPRTAFALAVLTEGGTPAESERTIARLARAAYNYFTR